jgi:hypothetical protein
MYLFNGEVVSAERSLYASSLDVPSIEILSSKYTFYVSDDLQFVSNLKFSSCNVSSGGILFQWRLARSSGQLLLGTNFEQNGALFILPPQALQPDSYVLKLTAYSPEWTVFSSAQFSVRKSPLVAAIDGGDRFVSPQAIALDASKSRDPDSDRAQLQFTWTCTSLPQQLPCIFANGQAVRIDSVGKPLLHLSFSEGVFVFTLQIQLQPPDGRQAFSQVTLTVKQSIRPIRLSPFQISTTSAGSSLTLNIGQRFSLLATEDRSGAPAQVRWSSNARSLDLSNVDASVFGQSGSVLLLTG